MREGSSSRMEFGLSDERQGFRKYGDVACVQIVGQVCQRAGGQECGGLWCASRAHTDSGESGSGGGRPPVHAWGMGASPEGLA